MRARILHESRGRIRLHLLIRTLSIGQADVFEAYLKSKACVNDAKVYERTADAVIFYEPGNEKCRFSVINAVSEFDFDDCGIKPAEHSSRALQHEYTDRLASQIIRFAGERLFMPVPARNFITVIRAVPFIFRGLKSLAAGKLTVSVLDAASIGVSILRRDFSTAGSVMFLLGIGDTMDEWIHKKSIGDLAGTMALNVEKVWMKGESGQEILVSVDKVPEGELIVVRTGNMIPLDGIVAEGDATVNQSSFTGEGIPVHKSKGGFVYGGTVIEDGELCIKVSRKSGAGRYDRIVKMIEESERLKSAAENRASNLADRLVPWTFAATALTYLVTRDIARAASILMVDFCCALKLSMPIAVLSAMREAGAYRISVKGGKYMESFAEADTIIFDKTGTLTHARPTVKDIITFDGNDKREG